MDLARRHALDGNCKLSIGPTIAHAERLVAIKQSRHNRSFARKVVPGFYGLDTTVLAYTSLIPKSGPMGVPILHVEDQDFPMSVLLRE